MANPDVEQQPVKVEESSSTFPSQMTLPNSNLTSVDNPESTGNNGVAILEPLFDKLVKKALTNVS